MRTDAFHFELPPERIADEPSARRDECRLLVLDRATGRVEHRRFRDLLGLLRRGDLLVVNDTRVIPARLIGMRLTGGTVEVLLLEAQAGTDDRSWTCLAAPGRKAVPGTVLDFGGGLTGRIAGRSADGVRVIELASDLPAREAIELAGHVPLPPYILARRHLLAGGEPGRGRSLRGKPDLHRASDRDRYQTVYARESGSIAAPTAGLHFTDAMLGEAASRGIERASVTLHVGLGTFRPIQTETLEEHVMHDERFELPGETAEAVRCCRERGGRVVAVGTTVVRTLEAVASGCYRNQDGTPGKPGLRAASGRTDVFLRPGAEFRMVDALVTNFHLPGSTLLVLVSAFAGWERVLSAYREAIENGYSFYSYGDAMVIL